MSSRSDRYGLRLAEARDDDGIREIFRSGSFDGGISLRYLREPSPLASFAMDGERAEILVIEDKQSGRVIAVGGAVVRTEYLNGKPEKCAYLTGLKIHPDYQKKIRFIAEAYRFLYGHISDCKCFYTTVLDGNTAAVSLFEKKHKGMPEYRYQGHITTYCFHGGKKLLPVEKGNTDGFEKLMETHFSKKNFAPVNYKMKGFGETEFFCLRENGGIKACCFIGNQQVHKQYEMQGYGGIYKPLSKLPTKLFGYPAFPKAGSMINYGTVSYLYIKDNNKSLCRDFLRSAAAETGFDLLIWSGFENDPLCAAMDGLKAVRYGSRLYTVHWDESVRRDGTECEAPQGVIGVEAALL